MPKPKPNEKESEYISRCVKQVVSEGKTQQEALGQCYGMFRQSKKGEIKKTLTQVMKILKGRTVSGYESPEPGNLPEAGKKILARSYAECRKKNTDKTKCSKIAWGAVRNAGYKSLDIDKVNKVFKTIESLIECDCGKK